MESKKLMYLFVFIGGTLGGYIPYLWGATYFSFSSLFFNALGALVGIWLAFKISY